MTTLIALAASLAALPALAQQDDKAQLLKIKAAFEQAAAQNKPELLAPYLADDFQGQMLFNRMQGKDGFKDLFDKTRDDLGRKNQVRTYKIEISPDDKSLKIGGGDASASGITKETIQTPFGPIEYRSNWTAKFKKQGSRWSMSRMDSHLDPTHSVSTAIASLVREAWNPLARLRLNPPKVDEPNYDGNVGLIRKQGAEALPAAR